MLQAKNLTKSYSGRTVVSDVNISVNRGEIVGLLGQNGAGKTTTFDMIAGLVKPDHGYIYMDEIQLGQMTINERAQNGMSYLAQEASAFRRLTVMENICVFLEMQGLNHIDQISRATGLLQEFEIFHLKDNEAISLSGGERRRLEIARSLTSNPRYLLLDEPFTGVDPIAIGELRVIIRHLIDKRKIGILLTDHNPRATLSITDRAYIIKEGQVLLEGKSADLASNAVAKQHYLGQDFVL